MSRIIVKNLPKHVGEDRLREVFSQKGEITDAKLMRTNNGKSRNFAFIGFRTEPEAAEALKHFNKSYLDTSRIICEIARKVGDPEIPRPWSRHSLKKQGKTTEDFQEGRNNVGAKEGRNNVQDSNSDDPKLQEFLELMQPRAKSKMWANDMVIDSSAKPNSKVTMKESVINEENKKSTSGSAELNDTKLEDESVEERQNHACDDVTSDMDYFKSRVKKDWSDTESHDDGWNDSTNNESDVSFPKRTFGKKAAEINLEEQHDNPSKDEKARVENTVCENIDPRDPSTSNKSNTEVLKTGRLFIRNLPYTASEDELEEHFKVFGEISEVHIVRDKDTKRSKGFAYVLYAVPESAVRALEELDSSIFQGRLLHVQPAEVKHPLEKRENNTALEGQITFKQKREEQRKAAEASGDTKAWNSLFMRSDTVVEYLARKYGVSKSDLLDREAGDLAVRIALGETQVIAETKKALENAGVNVPAMEESAARRADGMKKSNHVLLVRNLPYGSSEAELAKMFGKFGSLDKIILPPTRTLALVVFLEPAEARAAFKGLLYKRYKDVPLYLEWPPENILSPSSSENNRSSVVGEQEAKGALLRQQIEGVSDLDLDADRIESRSLYVKNLNFTTSDETLKRHFSQQMKEGKILSARVKKHVKNGKQLSMGFGFVEFDSMETATKVCRDLQGTVLDGHALILQFSQAKKDEQVAKDGGKEKSSTKLLVKNVAFEATKEDLKQLFSPFGQIKSLRLPKKFGNHRGFAFVEFVTKQEAQNAIKALSNTHLYGRHLVLDRAKEGETLEELRARTAAQFTNEDGEFQNVGKLSKKRKHLALLDDGGMKFEKF